jgi:hypothetical protein
MGDPKPDVDDLQRYLFIVAAATMGSAHAHQRRQHILPSSLASPFSGLATEGPAPLVASSLYSRISSSWL